VVAATRGLERGRVSRSEVDAALHQDLLDYVRVQEEAELDFYSDGLLRWQDIFRPLVDGSPGMTAHTLVRWFDNNAFFRAPQVNGPLSAIGTDALVPNPSVPRPRVATLPSPFMFSRAVLHAGDRNGLMQDLAGSVLQPAAKRLASEGCELIHVQEPWLAYFGIAPSDWPPFEQSLTAMRAGVGARVVLQIYFGDAAPHADRLRRLPVDAIGVDLVETDVASLGTDWPIGLMIGCLNARSSRMESLEDTVELIRQVARTVRPPTLYISANSDLELLPTALARQKVLLLGEAARKAKEKVAA
jgi:5-methyltetrahydropteroyltriglutamate--homocysteine methyltransferase